MLRSLRRSPPSGPHSSRQSTYALIRNKCPRTLLWSTYHRTRMRRPWSNSFRTMLSCQLRWSIVRSHAHATNGANLKSNLNRILCTKKSSWAPRRSKLSKCCWTNQKRKYLKQVQASTPSIRREVPRWWGSRIDSRSISSTYCSRMDVRAEFKCTKSAIVRHRIWSQVKTSTLWACH